MSVTFNELLELPEMENAVVIGGKKGLEHSIRWCHVFEMEAMMEWSTPNLLVFCTGIAFQNNIEQSLLIMVENLKEQRSAGLVLGIGAYIKEVPKSVVNRADELDFPLICIPDKIKFVDISFKLANMIFEKQATLNRQQLLMENIINDPGNDYGAELEYYGYLRNIPYRYVVINRSGKGRVPEAMTASINETVNILREKIHRKIFILNRMNQIILLVPDTKGTDDEFTFEDIIETLKDEISTHVCADRYVIAVSNRSDSPIKLSERYEETKILLKIGFYMFPEKQVLYYSDIGLFALTDFSKEEQLKDIITNTLGEVAEHEELVESLHAYITNGCSMCSAADAIFIHVNTMKYRMKKIDELLPKGITRNNAFELEGAVYLYKYFKSIVRFGQ